MKITKFFALMCAAATLSFAGCEPIDETPGDGDQTEQPGDQPGDQPGEPTTGTITLSVDKTAVQLGETIKLTVTQEGQDVTSAATIYDAATMNKVKNGEFTPESTGNYSFFATKGNESSNYVYVTVMASVPTLPEDTDAANTKFNHRILVIDHTGINCQLSSDD